MTGPLEAFTIMLGRSFTRAAGRYLRDLQRADRDDVLMSAILWCWENRTNYTPNASLEQWFVGAVRTARRDWERGEKREAAEYVKYLPAGDDTSGDASVRSTIDELTRSLTEQERSIAALRAQGFSRNEIRKQLGIGERAVRDANKRLRKLERLIPEPSEFKRVLRQPAPPDYYEDPFARNADASSIDREIESYLGVRRGQKESMYADDYKPSSRQRVPEEDVRGKPLVFPVVDGLYATEEHRVPIIQDYEGDKPNRRLLVALCGKSWWISEAHLP